MAKAQKTLTIDREVLAGLEERAAQTGLPVDKVVQRILRQELGFAQETRPAIREVPESILGEAYEEAWQEVDEAQGHSDFRSSEGTTST